MTGTIITVANHKGGVGKTASVATIGAILAAKGKKVLLIDLDTQANLTRHFVSEIPSRIVYHAIRERKDLPIYTIRENLYLTPSGLEMAGIEVEMTNMRRREDVLKDLITPLTSQFDYILLDCPPSLGLITMNALAATNKLIVPMKTDLMSSYGLNMMDTFCHEMQDLNPGLSIDFVFFNIYEKGQTMTEIVEADVRSKYGERVLNTVVRKNNDIAKSAFEYTDVISAYPNSNGAKDFQALVDELLLKIK